MAEDFSNYGQEVFISVSVTTKNTKSLDYILRNYLILTLFSFSIFGKNRVLNFSKLFISTVCTYHVPYAFQSESTLYNCLNVKELLARNRREI